MKSIVGIAVLAGLIDFGVAPAASEPLIRVYTQFDSDKCRHTRGQQVEDYGAMRDFG